MGGILVKKTGSFAAMFSGSSGRPSRALCLASLICLLAVSAGAAPERVRNHFDSDASMRPPGFFDFLVLGTPGKAEWRVMSEFNAPSAPNAVSQVLAQRPADSIAVAVRRNVQMRDGTLTIGLRRLDAQGGVVFRMADERNFLALLINPYNGDARLLSYRSGQPTELAHAKAKTPEGWAILGVTLAGPRVNATWDGQPLLDAADPQPVSGRTGMAAAGPGIATFDEFVIDPKE
jgi:hypothetical protein